jgi:hypothetical protein
MRTSGFPGAPPVTAGDARGKRKVKGSTFGWRPAGGGGGGGGRGRGGDTTRARRGLLHGRARPRGSFTAPQAWSSQSRCQPSRMAAPPAGLVVLGRLTYTLLGRAAALGARRGGASPTTRAAAHEDQGASQREREGGSRG